MADLCETRPRRSVIHACNACANGRPRALVAGEVSAHQFALPRGEKRPSIFTGPALGKVINHVAHVSRCVLAQAHTYARCGLALVQSQQLRRRLVGVQHFLREQGFTQRINERLQRHATRDCPRA